MAIIHGVVHAPHHGMSMGRGAEVRPERPLALGQGLSLSEHGECGWAAGLDPGSGNNKTLLTTTLKCWCYLVIWDLFYNSPSSRSLDDKQLSSTFLGATREREGGTEGR